MASIGVASVPKKKERSADKCREWEKVRRNKFNNAILELGKLIRQAIEDINSEESQSQFPKIEIVQKAIIFIKEYVKEIAQLKTQIVALELKLENEVKKKENRKDASTQIYRKINIKTKLKAPKKPVLKKISPKEAVVQSDRVQSEPEAVPTSANNVQVSNSPVTIITPARPHLANILPKPSFSKNNQPENTIYVLPAPYVLPPRPILLPAPQPTIFLLDPNIQPNNCKHPIQTLNRTQNEITKTTMVNILPISAYSHPVSVGKNKKSLNKAKTNTSIKTIKKNKVIKKLVESSTNSDNTKLNNESSSTKDVLTNITGINNKDEVNKLETAKPAQDESTTLTEQDKQTTEKENENTEKINIIRPTSDTDKLKTTILTNVTSNDNNTENSKKITTTSENTPPVAKVSEVKTPTKDNLKDKEKLQPLIDTEMSENTVEAGNARLELAEELLAASPTAAFLMSFPLVSGNRADSPAEEGNVTPQTSNSTPTVSQKSIPIENSQPDTYYTKTTQIDAKNKINTKSQSQNNKAQEKLNNSTTQKTSTSKEISMVSASIEYPFVSLSSSTMVSTNISTTDAPFSLDFECNLTKPSISNYNTSYANNMFYSKNDPFSTVKNTIYSSSNITSGHDYNSLSFYPCAVEKYASKNKSDYCNVEDNLMKINSSRLTYDIDLGWPHKSFDFVTCSGTTNTLNKDPTFTTSSTPFTSFNTDFQVNIGSNKKDNVTKSGSGYTDTITNLYSQTPNFWQDDYHFYSNSNMSKTLISKQQLNTPVEHMSLPNTKQNTVNNFDSKLSCNNTEPKTTHNLHHLPDKYTKKSPSKLHINWMTSETRSIVPPNNPTISVPSIKELTKSAHGQVNSNLTKKHEINDPNYFPIQINNLPSQIPQEEFQIWPSARPLGTTEISIDPPPINLPTLVGDLALGPHDKKKNDNKVSVSIADLPNYNSFLSVTQLMNRPNEIPTRYMGINGEEALKTLPSKQHTYSNENTRKGTTRFDTNYAQPYVFDDKVNNFDTPFVNNKTKVNKTPEKHSKSHKNNYSAEALIRSGTQKADASKFIMPTQKYNNFNSTHDGSMAQVSHFPPILDYSENTYGTQQLGGSNLYNSTSNTISNTFYTNFIPSSSNLMSSNYGNGNFSGEFIDYNQSVDCNYSNQKYEEFKMRNNSTAFPHDKVPATNYRNSRRDSATKHKLDCSKKESNKKYPSKKSKVAPENEDWSDSSHLLWHNRASNRKHGNLVSEEIFPNYHGSQVPGQYQAEFFNSHLMPTNVQVGHNIDRTVPSFPPTSRANFNLSTIFPEITMKVQ